MASLLVLGVIGLGLDAASANLLPNPSFGERAGGQAAHWRLGGGVGTYAAGEGRTRNGCLSVSRGADEASWWTCEAAGVQGGACYSFSFWGRQAEPGGGGCVVSGPLGMNHDCQVGNDWTRNVFVFPVAKGHAGPLACRLGTWTKKATVLFDDAELCPAQLFHRALGKLELGEGEELAGRTYRFATAYDSVFGAVSRPLLDFDCGFNTNRWTFDRGNWVVYRHGLGGLPFAALTVTVRIGYHTGGTLDVLARAEGGEWKKLGALGKLGNASFEAPKELFPAQAFEVKLARDDGGGALQVHGYEVAATLAEDPGVEGRGWTRHLAIVERTEGFDVTVKSLGDMEPGGKNVVALQVQAPAGRHELAACTCTLTSARGLVSRSSTAAVNVRAEAPLQRELTYDMQKAEAYNLEVAVGREGTSTLFRARASFSVPPLLAADFGWRVPAPPAPELGLWWCTSIEKVGQRRPLPAQARAVALELAANEEEAVQLVLRPARDMNAVRVRLEAPAGSDVTTRVREVAYVDVARPSDSAGCVGLWPDPLPEHAAPVDLAGNRNYPFWLSVRTAPIARARMLELSAIVEAGGKELARVPIALRVFGFALPAEHSIATAFGFSPHEMARYHKVTNAAETRKLFDLYMQNFRDHRISPSDFAPYDPIEVELAGIAWEGAGEVIAENPATGARCLKVVDASATASVAHETAALVPVEKGAKYVLSWQARAVDAPHPYLVTITTFDAERRWISGHNIDLPCDAAATWRAEQREIVVTERSPSAAFARITLRGAAWDERGSATGTVCFDEVSFRTAEGPELVADGGFEKGADAADVKVDFGAWDAQAAKYLDGYKFDAFSVPLQGLGGGTFYSRSYGRFGPFRQGTEGYRALMRKYALQLETHLAAKGWLGMEYIYWFDEPEEKDYEFVKEGMAEIRAAGPKLRRMLTEEPNAALEGSVDIWCPILDQGAPAKIKERLDAGETVWWYVCTGPRAPYLGLFIDHPATDLRVWSWLSWKYGVTGLLVWQSNYWTSPCAYPKDVQDPWKDPMSYVSGYGFTPGYVDFWGNGDGRFIYPPRNVAGPSVAGPVDSIRWEALRDGIEDYEYLALLKRTLDAARAGGADVSRFASLLSVPEAICADARTYTRDAAPIYERRRAVANAVEELAASAKE